MKQIHTYICCYKLKYIGIISKNGVFIAIISALVFWMFPLNQSNSADISYIKKNVESDTCPQIVVSFQGDVEIGDTKKLSGILHSIEDVEKCGSQNILISLNSAGGSYNEGLEIAALIRERGIGTIVEPYSKCYSSCALIFMHGIVKYEDGSVEYLNREMSKYSQVGFHAPYLDLSESERQQYDSSQVEEAYRVALYQFSLLLESGNNILNSDLLIRMLRTPPNELVFVESYRDLILWNIGLTENDNFGILEEKNIWMACKNMYSMEIKEIPDSKYDTYENWKNYDIVKIIKSEIYSTVYSVEVDEFNVVYCLIEKKKIGKKYEYNYIGLANGKGVEDIYEKMGSMVPYTYFFEPQEKIRR